MGILSSNQIKIIALMSMIIDHVGFMLLPDFYYMRIIGRIALPIFAYCIAEGCHYTKNKTKFFLLMFASGLIYDLVSFIFTKNSMRCVISSYALSIIMIYLFQYGIDKLKDGKKINYLISLLGVLSIFLINCIISIFMKIDYTVLLVLFPLIIYSFKNKMSKLIAVELMIFLLTPFLNFGINSLYSLISIPIILLYNGKRGKYNMKYFFYIIYPAHLVIIYLLYFAI